VQRVVLCVVQQLLLRLPHAAGLSSLLLPLLADEDVLQVNGVGQVAVDLQLLQGCKTVHAVFQKSLGCYLAVSSQPAHADTCLVIHSM
jgi:hypothetical protein